MLRRILLVYGELIRRSEAKQEVKPEWVSRSATIIREFIEDEKDEEEYVFPRLQKAGKLTDLVSVLLAQHKAGRRVTADVLRLAWPDGLKGDASRKQARRRSTFIRPHVRAALGPRGHDAVPDVPCDAE